MSHKRDAEIVCAISAQTGPLFRDRILLCEARWPLMAQRENGCRWHSGVRLPWRSAQQRAQCRSRANTQRVLSPPHPIVFPRTHAHLCSGVPGTGQVGHLLDVPGSVQLAKIYFDRVYLAGVYLDGVYLDQCNRGVPGWGVAGRGIS